MKKLLLALMIVTLMVVPALAEEVTTTLCDGPASHEFPVAVKILPWTQVTFSGGFDFGEIGFCNYEDGGRIHWINSNRFYREGQTDGLNAATTEGVSWLDLAQTVVKANGPEPPEVNPVVEVKTNAPVTATFQFVGNDWPVPIWIGLYNWKSSYGSSDDVGSYSGYFGKMIDGGPNIQIPVPAPAHRFYSLDAAILFQDDFWHILADDYSAVVQCTVAYPTTTP